MAYDPTQWNAGAAPGISADRLNKIEQGIDEAHRLAEDEAPVRALTGTLLLMGA